SSRSRRAPGRAAWRGRSRTPPRAGRRPAPRSAAGPRTGRRGRTRSPRARARRGRTRRASRARAAWLRRRGRCRRRWRSPRADRRGARRRRGAARRGAHLLPPGDYTIRRPPIGLRPERARGNASPGRYSPVQTIRSNGSPIVTPYPDPHAFHSALCRFNAGRLTPARIRPDWEADIRAEVDMRATEGYFVEVERARAFERAAQAPWDAAGFTDWFEDLRRCGPGQGDPLFPWLAEQATLEQMRWFLTQEAAGEAGFDDLVAMAQVKLQPVRAKLEMARNYWDEMGRGHERGMHGLMLHAVVRELGLRPSIADTVWESLALANLMVALAANRRYAYQAIGALGVIEMTAPGRVALVNEGLKRLGVATDARLYFQLHSELDVKHSKAWNAEVLYSIVDSDPELAQPIAEGALMRLACGARCFERYRRHFGLT